MLVMFISDLSSSRKAGLLAPPINEALGSLPKVTRQAHILKLPLVRTVVAAGDGALQLKPVVRAEHP